MSDTSDPPEVLYKPGDYVTYAAEGQFGRRVGKVNLVALKQGRVAYGVTFEQSAMFSQEDLEPLDMLDNNN